MVSTARKALAVVMAMTLVLFAPVVPKAEAKLTKVPAATVTNEQVSTPNQGRAPEWFKVTTPKDYAVCVEGKVDVATKRLCIRLKQHKASVYNVTCFVVPNAKGEFSISFSTEEGNKQPPQAADGKGVVAQPSDSLDTRPGKKAVSHMPAGTYHLTIARAWTAREADISSAANPRWWTGPLGGSSGYVYKSTILRVEKGSENNPKVVGYPAVENNIKSTRSALDKGAYVPSYKGSYVRYYDIYMRDISFVFKNPATGKSSPMTAKKVAWMKAVAAKVAPASLSGYEKLRRIYEYVANNFYYDQCAYREKRLQFSDPYRNLYNLRNNVTSKNSSASSSGKARVGVVCQGYSAAVVALCRASGISARLVRGSHISQPMTIWSDKDNAYMSTNTHWWVEAYVGGRWVVVDADAGSYNSWERETFESSGTWVKKRLDTYAYLDPTDEQLATSYSYNLIYKGANGSKYLNRTDETVALRSFLDWRVSGKSNGKRLRSGYRSADIATWGTPSSSDLLTDGYGRLKTINWSEKGLYGKFDVSSCKELTYANLYGNRLAQFVYWNGSRRITVKRSNVHGTVSAVYNRWGAKTLTVYARPYAGYKCLGIYNAKTGKRISAKTAYSFNPRGSVYVVKFVRR